MLPSNLFLAVVHHSFERPSVGSYIDWKACFDSLTSLFRGLHPINLRSRSVQNAHLSEKAIFPSSMYAWRVPTLARWLHSLNFGVLVGVYENMYILWYMVVLLEVLHTQVA